MARKAIPPLAQALCVSEGGQGDVKIVLLVEPLLGDKEYYVQKGVGCALREMHTVYPKETMPFLQKHIKKISAIAFTIAIEKMTAA